MNVVLTGSQIDQCVILSKSLLSLFPSSEHSVTLSGRVFADAHSRQSSGITGYIFDAYSYGYFRALLIRVQDTNGEEKILTVGGSNAIIEDVALQRVEFQVTPDAAGYKSLLRRPAPSGWITDAYLLSLEFGGVASIGEILERIALSTELNSDFSKARRWEAQRV